MLITSSQVSSVGYPTIILASLIPVRTHLGSLLDVTTKPQIAGDGVIVHRSAVRKNSGRTVRTLLLCKSISGNICLGKSGCLPCIGIQRLQISPVLDHMGKATENIVIIPIVSVNMVICHAFLSSSSMN